LNFPCGEVLQKIIKDIYLPKKLINKRVVVIAEVTVVRTKEIVGIFILNIFLFSGSTITTSLGSRK
jgi:hypothetical protein